MGSLREYWTTNPGTDVSWDSELTGTGASIDPDVDVGGTEMAEFEITTNSFTNCHYLHDASIGSVTDAMRDTFRD